MGFLRELFGPSQQEIWETLCKEIEADIIDEGFFRGKKVVAKVRDWVIIFDTYTVSSGRSYTTYTRIRAPYSNKDGFKFRFYRKGVFSEIGKLLGFQDVEVGYPDFDDNFIIKGNDTDKLLQLFSNSQIRQLIEMQPNIYFEVIEDGGWFGDELPEGVDELYFQVPEVIQDVNRLKTLYFLFVEVLNQLCLMDSAYEDSPDITLN